MNEQYELGTAPPARRALADRLPPEVAAVAAELIIGPLLHNPQRVDKPLGEELAGIYSARLGRNWRVRYEIDDTKHAVIVLDIRHRSASGRHQPGRRLEAGQRGRAVAVNRRSSVEVSPRTSATPSEPTGGPGEGEPSEPDQLVSGVAPTTGSRMTQCSKEAKDHAND